MFAKSFLAALVSSGFAVTAFAGTTTWTIYEGPQCTGNVVQTSKVGSINQAHTLGDGQTFFSVRVSNIDQSFFGQQPAVHGIIINVENTRALIFSLTNDNPPCHTLTNAFYFGLDNTKAGLGNVQT
ncbi:hypothetical protein NA57DRAFT_60920 [Rhizodiscina lignyota]|uniref:Uncharacterized protein n=1 Tax=Rhizodiscina lignyota TaxID=1504668 RepID=A0A9P4I7T3_9PEZI|nr:hypothetical protein NA57DRAFT_60920 [Rhizodiscina lignyota]